MVLSPYFSDNDVVCQLRSFFDIDEQWTTDFIGALANVTSYDENYLQVLVKDRKFLIHRIHGGVQEVKT